MIKVNDLSFTYPGNRQPTLLHMSFDIQPGEIFGFLGPSGAGKSTTQKILNGILKHYAGSVQILNTEMGQVNRSFYENIGVAFEFPNLYLKFTALENLNRFRSLYRDQTEEPERLLEQVGLLEDKHTRVSAFSKGMRMRLNFCRALLNKPKILFLDEPTSGLDPINARRVKDIILARKQNSTIFLTTHNMTDADELCDRIAFIVDGQLAVVDSPRNLKLQNSSKTVRVEFRQDGQIVRREFPLEDIGANAEFSRLLQHKPIETIHTGEATLEDIFIKITGRTLI